MVKRGWLPGTGGMACLTSLAQGTLVRIFADMAGITIGGRALENSIDMATGTNCTDMRTC